MNLLHKFGVAGLFICVAALNAQNENGQTQDMAQTFTLSVFANSDKQEKIVTDFIQKSGLSDEKIAQLLEVEPAAVTRVRTYFGPREVEKLAKLAADGYKNRCYKRTIIDAGCILLSMTALAAVYGGFAFCCWKNMEIKRLTRELERKKWFWQRS